MLHKQNIWSNIDKHRRWCLLESKNNIKQLFQLPEISVLYFNQHLGAAHSKWGLKYAFSMLFCAKKQKKEEKQKNWGKIYQKILFLSFLSFFSSLQHNILHSFCCVLVLWNLHIREPNKKNAEYYIGDYFFAPKNVETQI